MKRTELAILLVAAMIPAAARAQTAQPPAPPPAVVQAPPTKPPLPDSLSVKTTTISKVLQYLELDGGSLAMALRAELQSEVAPQVQAYQNPPGAKTP